MIHLKGVSARAARYRLSNVSLEVDAGVRSILGKPADGAPLLLAVLAGWVRPRSGEALVLGGSPEAKRQQIAYVPLDVRLPPSLRVSETLELAAAVRGESAVAPPRARLEVLGIAPLAERWTDSLTPAETRAVALVEAITSTARVLLLDEPLVDLDPRACAGLASSLRDRARSGASVIIGTSSPRDALDLSDEQWVLDRGRVAITTRATDTAMLSASPKPRLRVLAQGARQGARALLGALASEPSFVEIEMDGDALLLAGTDAAAMAESVSRAALAAGVELEVLRLEAPSLDQLRASTLRRTPLRAAAGAP